MQTKQLTESRFTFWGVTYRDGAAMTSVKESLTKIHQQMRISIPLDESASQESFQTLHANYAALIGNCKTYVSSHCRPITASGKARLQMVQKVLSQAEHELEQLPAATELLLQTKQRGLLWGNILGIAREMDVDLDKAEKVEQGGAGTSDVTIISTGKSKLFFKETEQLCSSQDEIQRQYIDGCKNKKDLAIYRELKNLLVDDTSQMSAVVFNNKNIRTMITSSDPQQQKAGFAQLSEMMKMSLPECNLDLSDTRVREILQEILPRYTKWLTRSFVCQTAMIQPGSFLSKRNVATSRMAQLLNVSHLIPLSCTAKIHSRQAPQACRGIIMAQAKGVPLPDLQNECMQQNIPLLYTPEAVRQLSQLQLFDTICGQIDRNLSNRFVTYQKVDGAIQITGIQGIDNDMAFGRMDYQELNRTVDGTYNLPVFQAKNKCTLPALDGNLVASLFALSEEAVRHIMADLLTEEDINALLNRIAGVKQTIQTSMQTDPKLVVDSDHWDDSVTARFNEKQVNKAYADFYGS